MRIATRPGVLCATAALCCGACGSLDPWQPSAVAELAPLAELDDEIGERPPLWGADDRVPYEPTPAELADAELALADSPTIHFVNFSDGTTVLMRGPDSAVLNTSIICAANPFPAYEGNESTKRSMVAALANIMKDFNVVLVTSRPLEGVYSMEMVGPQGNGCNPGAFVLGIAPMDCGNRNKQNISFTFRGNHVTAAQESGHAFGLEHADVVCDVMGAGYSQLGCVGGNWRYPDVEGRVLGGVYCGSPTQNSYRRMEAAVGLWPGGAKPDPWLPLDSCGESAPPALKIVQPADGAAVAEDFVIAVEASDECGIRIVRVSLAPIGLEADAARPPFEWDVTQITGRQTITVTAIDQSGKTTTSSITVDAPGSPPGDGGSRDALGTEAAGADGIDHGGGGGSGGTGGAGGGAGGPGADTAGGAGRGGSSSGCTSVPGPQSGGWGAVAGMLAVLLAVLALLAALRRCPAGGKSEPLRPSTGT